MARRFELVLMGVMVAATAQGRELKREMTITAAEDVKWSPLNPKDTAGKGPQFSLVFGDLKKKGPVGFLLKVPAGFRPGPHTHDSDTYVVVLKGTMHNFAPGSDEGKAIGPGGSWFEPGKVGHDHHCDEGSECVLSWYVPDGFDFTPLKTAAEAGAGR